MKKVIVAVMAGILLGPLPAGASSFSLTAKPSTEVYPKVDGYKDSIFLKFSTGTRCIQSSRVGIRNVLTGERVFLVKDVSPDGQCDVGLGHRWWGRYGIYGTGKHVPYGKYRVAARVVLRNGDVLTDSQAVYVRRG